MRWTSAENKLCSYLIDRSPRYNKRSKKKPTIIRYGVAACLLVVAWSVSEYETDILFGVPSVEAFYFAVLLAARVLGKGPAWICAALSMLYICWVLPPDESLMVDRAHLHRAASNAAAIFGTLLLWPSAGFGDWFYRLASLQRRAIESSKDQNSSSLSAIGRPSAASRSTITS
jgi:hypothetical protein